MSRVDRIEVAAPAATATQDATGGALGQLSTLADIFGGFATFAGVLIALVAGWIAFKQLSGQQKIFWEQSYGSLFAEYIKASEAFFEKYPSTAVRTDAPEIRSFVRELAHVLHYLTQIDLVSQKKPQAFTPIDYVVLSSDLDALKAHVISLGDSWRHLWIRKEVLRFEFDRLRRDLGESITTDQETIIRQFESEVADAAANPDTTDDEDRRVYEDIEASLNRRFGHQIVKRAGDLTHPELFQVSRMMQNLSLIKDHFEELGPRIHAQAVRSAGGEP